MARSFDRCDVNDFSAMTKTQAPKADRIVFTGDFLRPAAGGWEPAQHENIQWFHRLLEVPIKMATGLPSEIVHWDNNWLNHARFDGDAVAAIYGAFWGRPDIGSWPRIYESQKLPDFVEEMFLSLFGGSFVVGFELPPYLLHFFKRHKIEFIDCALSPVRFMDDLLFNFSSSSVSVTEVFQANAVPEALIQLQAGVLASNVAKMNPTPPSPNSLLLVLQTRYDKALIENGVFVTVLDHLDALANTASQYDNLLVKLHPLEAQDTVAEAVLSLFPNASTAEDGFYRLVAHPNIKAVAALSSSCVHEAKFFGKEGHYLLPGYPPKKPIEDVQDICLDDIILAPDFWRDVFDALGVAVTNKDGLRLAQKPNRFRQQLRSAWGYNQIDTDIFLDWARP